MKILRAYGIPAKIVQQISDMSSNTSAKVISPDGETDTFNNQAGVLQGDTLAPYLFVIALDYAFRKAISGREEELGLTIHPRRSRRVGPVSVADLGFADDIALMSDTRTVEQAQVLLISVEDQCGKLGLTLNSKKTVVVPFNISGNAELTTLSGEVVGVKEDFKYLSSYISSTEKDIDMRKAQTWRALHKLNNIWHSNMSETLKRRIFMASVESILTYGCEA